MYLGWPQSENGLVILVMVVKGSWEMVTYRSATG